MRIVVIGATGHIGTWLIPRLVRSGHDVVAVSRGLREPYREAAEWSGVEKVAIDRGSAEREGTFGKSIAAMRADAVIDLICFDVRSASHLLNALRDGVGHFIHCGTLWVHGIPKSCPYDETAVREPFGEYGIAKAAIERYLLDEAALGFPATILHPGHITGPGWIPINPAGNLDLDVFDRLSRGATVELPDDGTARLQHVHVDDVACAFELAVENRERSIGESFHVAAPKPITMRHYAETVAGWYGRDANLEFVPWEEWKRSRSARDVELTLDHMQHSPCASIEKAHRTLGFAPRLTAAEAVRDALSSVLPAGTA